MKKRNTELKDRFGKEIIEGCKIKCYGNIGVVQYIAPSFVIVEEIPKGKRLHRLIGADSEHEPVEVLD